MLAFIGWLSIHRQLACYLGVLLLAGGGAAAFTAIEADNVHVGVEWLAVTPTGTPWAVVKDGEREGRPPVRWLRYWDGKAFRQPEIRDSGYPEAPDVHIAATSRVLSSDHASAHATFATAGRCVFAGRDVCVTDATFTVRFVGGGDRDAWAIVRPYSGVEGQGYLIQLGTHGTGICETVPMPHWATELPAPLYVARDGRVFHWGSSFLAVRGTNGVWRRSAAVLPSGGGNPHSLALVFERDGDVWIFVSPMLYRVDADCGVTGRLVPDTPVSARNPVAHCWGDDRIVAWTGDYPPHARAFDIETLAPVPWPSFPAAWDVREAPVFVRRDGTVWLTRYSNQKAVVAVPPGATRPHEIPGVPFPHPRCEHGRGTTALACADGTIFSGSDGVTLIAPDLTVRRYDWRHGLAGPSTDVQQTPDGRVWFLNNGRIVSFDPAREPRSLPGGGCWEQVAELADVVEMTGTNHPARTGGFFRYPRRDAHSIYGWETYRLFEGTAIPIVLVGTPIVGEQIMHIEEDEAGSLVFLSSQNAHPIIAEDGKVGLRSDRARRFRYTPPCGVAATAPPPATSGRELTLPLDPGAAWRQRVHLARTGDGAWELIPASQTPVARFRFPSAGRQTCEVIAFDYGGRVPGALTFTVQAAFDLPETRRRDGGVPDALVDVNAHPWHPPVRAVPSSAGVNLRLVWRPEDETEWRPLNPGGVSVVAIGRGERTLLFSAEENGIWRDPSPLRLRVRVALPFDAYLDALQQDLRVYPQPDWAVRALRECGPAARARLNELAEMAARRKHIEEALHLLGSRREGGGQ